MILKLLSIKIKQLEGLKDRVQSPLHARINIALSSVEAARLHLNQNKDFSHILYLLGRAHWTLGFITGLPREDTVKIEPTIDDPAEITKVTKLPTPS